MANIIRALLLALALIAPQHAHAREPFTLDAVRAQVKQDYAQVPQLSTQALAAQVKQGADILLLDVRESKEFAVSRIKGAQRVDPGIWRWKFMNRFGKHVRGKTVVFYCSVGVRSSRLAENVMAALKEKGAKAVYNLDGGVFAWHNEARSLVNAKGATDYVHPFDSNWGKLVERQALVKSMP
jgi:rhodanese-related sulfurtransferase